MSRTRRKETGNIVTCRECSNSMMFHELNPMGEPFLCKCKFMEWSQFLDKQRICNNFKPRKQ